MSPTNNPSNFDSVASEDEMEGVESLSNFESDSDQALLGELSSDVRSMSSIHTADGVKKPLLGTEHTQASFHSEIIQSTLVPFLGEEEDRNWNQSPIDSMDVMSIKQRLSGASNEFKGEIVCFDSDPSYNTDNVPMRTFSLQNRTQMVKAIGDKVAEDNSESETDIPLSRLATDEESFAAVDEKNQQLCSAFDFIQWVAKGGP